MYFSWGLICVVDGEIKPPRQNKRRPRQFYHRDTLIDLDLDRGATAEAPETVGAIPLLEMDNGSASKSEQDVVLEDGEPDTDETYPVVVAPWRFTEIFDG
ncbi:hypothetical protein GGR56DRAFT_679028 [Xylariaceae sp. FL0804]|nr:hypothetical protein GGR56DRAFT_679028 [Xylariaceae sp. FL0804]